MNVNLSNHLATFLADPANLAAVVGAACAVRISQLKAVALGVAIAVGLCYFGFPAQGICVAAALVLAWLIHCATYPRAKCIWCGGGGEFKTSYQLRTVAKRCWACKGDSTKIRLGRRLLTPILGAWRL